MARYVLGVFLIGALQAPPAAPEDAWTRLWRELLEQQNDQVRKGALDRLVRCGPRAARVAALFLQGQGRDIPALIAKLDSDEFADRDAATLALLEIGAPAVEALKAALTHDSAEVRYRAKDLLARIAADEAGAPRRKLTGDALAILGRSGGREHLPLLVPSFTSEDPKIRDQAITAAARLASAADAPLFEGILRSPDETVRLQAVRILGDIAGPIAHGRLLRLLRDEDSAPVRTLVRNLLRRQQIEVPADVTAAWTERAAGKDGRERLQAIHSLILWSRLTRGETDALWALIEKSPPEARREILAGLLLPEGPIVARFLVDPDPANAALARAKLASWTKEVSQAHYGWDPAGLARMALDAPPDLKAKLQDVLLEEGGEPLGLADAVGKGDVAWVVAAAAQIRRRESHPEWIAPLARMRDGLPPGRDRDVVEALLFQCGEGRPAGAALRLLEDPDPRRAGLGIDLAGALGLWEAAPRLRDFQTGHTGPVVAVAFRPDGRTLVSAGTAPALVIWDATTGRRVRALNSPSPATCLAVSADGRTAVSGHEDATLAVWNLEDGERLRVLKGHPMPPRSVALSPDGSKAISGDTGKTVVLWDLEQGRELRRWGESGPWVGGVAWSPDGTRTLAASGVTLTLREAGGERGIRAMASDRLEVLQCVVFSRDGALAYSGGTGGEISPWELATGTKLRPLTGHVHGVQALALSPDGRSLLSGSVDQTMRLWDVGSGKFLRVFEGRAGWVNAVAWDREGKLAAAGNQDGTVGLWDAATGRRLRSLIPQDLRRRSQAALELLARGPSPDTMIPAPELEYVGKRAALLVEILRVGDSGLVQDAFAELKQLPLVRLPAGFDALAAVKSNPREADAVRRLVDTRRETPKILAAFAAGEGPRARLAVSKSGYEQLRYEIVAGAQPAGEEAFTAEGAVRISEATLLRLVVGFDWVASIPVLRNSGLKAPPAGLRALLAPGEAGRYRAAQAYLRAGWTDALPAVYELLEKDPEVPRIQSLLGALVKADPARALQALSQWSTAPLSEPRRKLVLDLVAQLPGRKEIYFQLLQGPDAELAREAAVTLAGGASPETVEEFRRLRREGKLSDPGAAAALIRMHATADDLPHLRELVKSSQKLAVLEAGSALLRVGGAAEVEAALAALRHDPSYLAPKLAPLVTEAHRKPLEALLEAPEPADKRIVRLLLAKAGRIDTIGDVLDTMPKGTGEALVLAAVVGSLKDEALLRKALKLAENWTDKGSHELIWAALVNGPLALGDAQLETLAAGATKSELRTALASRLARAWKPELLPVLRRLLQSSPGRDAEELLSTLEPLRSLEVAQATLDALTPLIRARVSGERIARVLTAPADRETLAPRLLTVHKESIRGMTLLDPLNIVLAAARGTAHEELRALLQTYLESTEAKLGGAQARRLSLSSRLIAAESLAATEPESAEAAAAAVKLARSPNADDRAVGIYYQGCRGRRLSEVEWGLLPTGDTALFLGVAMRIPNAAGDAWEGWKRSAFDQHDPEQSRRMQAVLSLLTSREFDIPIMVGTPELVRRQEQGLRTAREWFVAHWNKSFEESFLEALAAQGYKVGTKPDLADASELVRALRDSRWYLARNAAWLLGRIAKDGPRVPETVLLGGSELRAPAQPPDPREIDAWEQWDLKRRR